MFSFRVESHCIQLSAQSCHWGGTLLLIAGIRSELSLDTYEVINFTPLVATQLLSFDQLKMGFLRIPSQSYHSHTRGTTYYHLKLLNPGLKHPMLYNFTRQNPYSDFRGRKKFSTNLIRMRSN